MEITLLAKNDCPAPTDLLPGEVAIELEYEQEIRLLKTHKLKPAPQSLDYILDKIKAEL